MVESQAMPLGREDYKYPKGSFYLVMEGRSSFFSSCCTNTALEQIKKGSYFYTLGRYPWIQQKRPKDRNALNYISLQKAFTHCQAVQIIALFSF